MRRAGRAAMMRTARTDREHGPQGGVATKLDQAIDRLYATDPEDFVAARDTLAKQLREAGDRDGARVVKALRRPTVPAWAVNRLSRDEAAAIRELAAAGTELRKAQRLAASGGRGRGSGMREALARRRAAVERLQAVAVRLLADSGHPGAANEDAVGRTLEAASVDEEAMERVRGGRLDRPLDPPTGFGTFAPLTVVPGGARDEPEEAGDAAGGEPARARRAADLAAERRHEAERTAREAKALARSADDAERVLAKTRREREALEARLRDVRAREREAAARARVVTERAQRAAEVAARAAERAERS